MTTIAQLQKRAYRQSADKGFHDHQPATPAEALAIAGMKMALFHSEVSEALEELRDGHAPDETYYREDGKPEGVPPELADVVIRVLDFAEDNGIDLEAAIIEKLDYNATRAHKHGGKEF